MMWCDMLFKPYWLTGWCVRKSVYTLHVPILTTFTQANDHSLLCRMLSNEVYFHSWFYSLLVFYALVGLTFSSDFVLNFQINGNYFIKSSNPSSLALVSTYPCVQNCKVLLYIFFSKGCFEFALIIRYDDDTQAFPLKNPVW